MDDIIQLERDITAWVAGKLNLVIDTNIFRGGIPAGVDSGVGVMLNSQSQGNYPSTLNFNVQVLGKYDNRDDAWRMLNKLSSAVPCYGDKINETIFVSILPRGNGEPYQADDDGKVKTFASFNMIVSVC
jgi:hypothetical protein